MNELLRVENLKKYYKVPVGYLHAVDGVSFVLREGETLGVVGESGCGKTTLGRTILGLVDSTGGRVIFKDRDITNFKGAERKNLRKEMQIIFQDPFASLNPRLNVSELLSDALKAFHLYKSKHDRLARVYELMDLVGLARRFANSYPHELDGGRRQRIGVARALSLNPNLIVCDEPVSALDVSIQAQILNLLQDLQEQLGVTYIFITHDLSVVKHISNDIMVMYVGCMVEKCESKALFANPLHPYTKGLLSAIPIPDVDVVKKRIILQGELISPVNPKPGCRFAPRCQYATEQCMATQPVYEEIMDRHFVACHNVREINGL